MRYRLRVNHHATDHGRLILDGIRPALVAARARAGPVPAALRPHWRDGPHILIGLDTGSAAEPDAAWSILENGIAGWLAQAPPPEPLDPDEYHERSIALAEFEEVSYERRPLRPPNSIERGLFEIPPPVATPALAPIRDSFKAASLETIFDLVETRLADPPRGLLDYALLILCLERLEWRDGLSLWPLSLRGQALIGASVFPRADLSFPAMADRLEARFLALVEAEHLLDPDAELPPRRREWVATLQSSYDRLLDFVDRADPAFFANIHARMLEAPAAHNETLGLSQRRAADIMASPTHFAYRMLVNFLYEMLPSVGFAASRRLFVCFFITRTIERHFPEVHARTQLAGSLV
jgi:hypothetical protein